MPIGVVPVSGCVSLMTWSGLLASNSALYLSRWTDWDGRGSGLLASRADEGSTPVFARRRGGSLRTCETG